MEKIKVNSIGIESRSFVSEETGEVSESFVLVFDVAVPVMKKQNDGTFAKASSTTIIKPASNIAAMLYEGCPDLRRVRTLKGSSMSATEIAAYLDGATGEVSAELVKAGTVDGDYTWQHDGYKYSLNISLAADIASDIKTIAREIRRKALGL